MNIQIRTTIFSIAVATFAGFWVTACGDYVSDTEKAGCDPDVYGFQWERNSKQACIDHAIAIVKQQTGKDVSDLENWDVFRNTLDRFTAQLDTEPLSQNTQLRNYTDCTRTNISPPVWEGQVFVCVQSEV
ncbi:MAG: hypothetical protein OXG25_07690 [Gammaproteobacteria bacterium]|nr:hypothetical protein [Gammaproteobacteria bacterium]